MENMLPVGAAVAVAHPATINGTPDVFFGAPVDGVVIEADSTDDTYLVTAPDTNGKPLHQWVDAASVTAKEA